MHNTFKVSFICIFQVCSEYLTQSNGDGLRKKTLFYVLILNVLHSLFILEDLKMSTMAYLGGSNTLVASKYFRGKVLPPQLYH